MTLWSFLGGGHKIPMLIQHHMQLKPAGKGRPQRRATGYIDPDTRWAHANTKQTLTFYSRIFFSFWYFCLIVLFLFFRETRIEHKVGWVGTWQRIWGDWVGERTWSKFIICSSNWYIYKTLLHKRLREHCRRRGKKSAWARGSESLLWGCLLVMSEATHRKPHWPDWPNRSWIRMTPTDMINWTEKSPGGLNPKQRTAAN